MFLFLLTTVTHAADCPSVQDLVASARSSFDDAELDAAEEALLTATDSLDCQGDVVPTDVLLALYRLHVLVDLGRQDRQGAVYASIRAVAAEPDSAPPADYGPQLIELYATWRARLGDQWVQIGASAVDGAWVDGHDVVKGGRTLVGEHLLQWRDKDGFHSEVRDLAGDTVITGTGSTVVAVIDDPPPPVEDPDPIKPPKDPKPPRDPKERTGGGNGLGVALVAGGGGAVVVSALPLVLGWQAERQFKSNTYDADVYGTCDRDDRCYYSARRDAIVADAGRVRLMYGLGYGLAAAGAALTVGGVVTLGSSGDDLTVGVRGRF